MLCPVPFIDLPPELIEANSSSNGEEDSASRQSRQRRAAAADDSSVWMLFDRLWHWARSGSWQTSTRDPSHRSGRQKRAPVAHISNENVSMSMYLGFIMDKLPSLRNISKTKPNLRLELLPFLFQCCDHTYVDFDPAVNPLITIEVLLCRCLSLPPS